MALFPQDNNGVLIDLPAVSAAGATTLNGSLIFGIGTQSNNALGSATVYATDQYGNFSTNFNGASMTTSFIDSGSNGLFFNDASIPTCPSPPNTWYCPTQSPMILSATDAATTGAPSGVVSFNIVNVDNLGPSVVAANIGGPAIGYFDWGLPFFFSRPVFTAISGASTPGGSGPYFAY